MATARDPYIDRRKGRCMAQVLEAFETLIQPHLPADKMTNADEFKTTFRKGLTAFADEASDRLLIPPGQVQNGAAIEVRDSVEPHGHSR